jgi:hypothetical protein
MKKLLYLLLAISLFASCKKDSNDDTTPTPSTGGNNNNTGGSITINSTNQVSMKVDGTPLSKIENGSNVESSVHSNSLLAPYPDTSHGIWGSSLYNPSATETYINITKGGLKFIGAPASNTAFKNFFNPGTYSYDVSGSTYLTGIEISLFENSVFYSSSMGSQAGSSFTITDMVEVTGGSYYAVKVRATFHCKVYDGVGGIKTLTEGIYVGHFMNF